MNEPLARQSRQVPHYRIAPPPEKSPSADNLPVKFRPDGRRIFASKLSAGWRGDLSEEVGDSIMGDFLWGWRYFNKGETSIP